MQNKKQKPFDSWNINTLESLQIDIRDQVARKAARLLFGQGLNLSSENEEINKFLNKIKISSKIDNILYANEKMLSKYGRTIITLDKTKTGEYRFAFVDPRITSKVGRAYVDEVSAVIWKRINHDDRMYWIKEEYDTKKVQRTIFNGDKDTTMTVMGYNAIVPKHLQVEEVWHHNLGVLPLVEFHNLPDESFDENWLGYNPDDRNVADLRDVINNLIVQSVKESILNKTRAFANLTPSQMEKAKANMSNDMKMLAKDLFTQTNALNRDGIVAVTTQQGNPKFEAYLDAIQSNMRLYYNGCGYEYDKGDQASAQTATGSMLGKALDVETTKEKRQVRSADIMRLVDRVLQCEGYMKSPYDAREYVFEIKENLVIDEFKKTETIRLQLEAGLISRTNAVAVLNGGISETEAEQLIEKIDDQLESSPIKPSSYVLEDEEGNQFEGKTPYEAGYVKEQANKNNKIKRK